VHFFFPLFVVSFIPSPLTPFYRLLRIVQYTIIRILKIVSRKFLPSCQPLSSSSNQSLRCWI
jgi:hypothetical protein